MSGPRPQGADAPPGVGSFGLAALLVSLGVLFLASLVSAWWLHDDPARFPDGLPPLPAGLWLSTALLGLLSWAMERRALKTALALALLFLGAQAWNWRVMLDGLPADGKSLYAFHFYMLTLLHAVHVLGGLVWHGVAMARPRPQTVRYAAIYWHFLGVVWVLLYANLWLVRMSHDFGTPLSLVALGILGGLTIASAACWWHALRLLAARGERGMALFGVFFPPFAFLQIWARAEEFRSERLALRWGVLLAAWLIALIFAGAVHAAWMRGLDDPAAAL